MSILYYLAIERRPPAKDVVKSRVITVGVDDDLVVILRRAESDGQARSVDSFRIYKPSNPLMTSGDLEDLIETDPLRKFATELSLALTFRDAFALSNDALILPRTPLIVLFEFSSSDVPYVDISSRLLQKWNAPFPSLLSSDHLRAFMNAPLEPDEKTPIPNLDWERLLKTDPAFEEYYCPAEILEKLFTKSTTNTADTIWPYVYSAIVSSPPESTATEIGFISFWDYNIVNILRACLGAVKWTRNNNQGTQTGSFRPDFALFMNAACVFRGEEAESLFPGIHPRDELVGKTRWVYDPASYILGVESLSQETNMTMNNVHQGIMLLGLRSPWSVSRKNTDRSQQQSITATDIVRFNLSTRKSRVENVVRMIRLVKLLRTLERVVARDVDRDMLSLYLEGGKSIEFFRTKIRKSYQRQGSKIVPFLVSLYGALGKKCVPNVDRLVKSEVSSSNTFVILEPRGISTGPRSAEDVKNAVTCVLEALIALHTSEPVILHRDIRWPNIVQNVTDHKKWFIIDFEDAAVGRPTTAAMHLNVKTHSPRVFQNDHGPEVDIWGVGKLITTKTYLGISTELLSLGRRMIDGSIVTAEQALEEIRLL